MPFIPRLDSLWIELAWAAWTLFGLRISFVDVKERRIPNRLLGPLTLVIVILLAIDGGSLSTAILGGIASFVALLVLHIASRGGIGAGDVKFAMPFGLMTGNAGWSNFLSAWMVTCLLAGIWAVYLLFSNRQEKGVPFGPCMVLGALATLIV